MIELIPHCYDCCVKLIATVFDSGIVRYICPECKKRLFLKQGKDGIVKANNFEITEAQGYFGGSNFA